MARLTILNGERVEDSLEIDDAEILIGRQADAAVHLASSAVSRRHARIRRLLTGHVLEDLGSVNGVAVDGSKVKSHSLEEGQRIEIEQYTLVFEPDEDLYGRGLEQGRPDAPSRPDFSATYISLSGLPSLD